MFSSALILATILRGIDPAPTSSAVREATLAMAASRGGNRPGKRIDPAGRGSEERRRGNQAGSRHRGPSCFGLLTHELTGKASISALANGTNKEHRESVIPTQRIDADPSPFFLASPPALLDNCSGWAVGRKHLASRQRFGLRRRPYAPCRSSRRRPSGKE
jgi:hypothetical protein